MLHPLPRRVRSPYTPVAMDEYLRANRRLWDAWTDAHVGSTFYDVESFRAGGERGIRIKDYEREEVGDVRGKRLLHLQCHFGLETLSWARLGATVTGVDFSEKGIAQAKALAAELQIRARFLLSNVYDLPRSLNEEFDIVFSSIGVINWLPDLAAWAK